MSKLSISELIRHLFRSLHELGEGLHKSSSKREVGKDAVSTEQPIILGETKPGKRKLGSGLKHAKRVTLAIIALALLVLIAKTSFYTVKEYEEAVVTTFGRYTRTVGAGLHMKWPWPLQSLWVLPTRRTQKLELGYVDRSSEHAGSGDYASVPEDSLMITGDLNVVSIDFFLEWRISDPKVYLFSSENPKLVLRNMLMSSVRSVVGMHEIDEVLTTGKVAIQTEVKDILREKLKETDIGVQVVDVKVNDSEPPTDEVARAFRAVENAKQQRDTAINNANQYKNSVVPKAKGQADAIVQQAEGRKQSRENEALGELQRFQAIYEQYSHYPLLTRERMYLEMLEKRLPGLKVIIDDAAGDTQKWLAVDASTPKTQARPFEALSDSTPSSSGSSHQTQVEQNAGTEPSASTKSDNGR